MRASDGKDYGRLIFDHALTAEVKKNIRFLFAHGTVVSEHRNRPSRRSYLLLAYGVDHMPVAALASFCHERDEKRSRASNKKLAKFKDGAFQQLGIPVRQDLSAAGILVAVGMIPKPSDHP